MSRFKVVGLKRFTGRVDGNDIDSGKLFVECKLDDSRNGKDQHAAGIFTEELRLPSAELVRRIEHLTLPYFADIQTERVGNGKMSREVVLDIRPIQSMPQGQMQSNTAVVRPEGSQRTQS
jgi:hypothetical protein